MSIDKPNPTEQAIAEVLNLLKQVREEHFSRPSGEIRLHHDLTVQMQQAGLALRALGIAYHRHGDACTCPSDDPLAA